MCLFRLHSCKYSWIIVSLNVCVPAGSIILYYRPVKWLMRHFWLSRLLTCNLMFSDVTDFKMNSWTFSQCEFCVSVCTLSLQEMLTHLVELPRRLYSLKHAHRLIWQLITAGVINTLAFSETLRALHLYSLYTQRSTAGGHSYYNYSLVLTGSQCSFQINYAIMDGTTSVVQALMGFSSHHGLGLKTLYIDPHAVHETLVAVWYSPAAFIPVNLLVNAYLINQLHGSNSMHLVI